MQKNQQEATPPRTWLVESILTTVFCCLPLGAVGIYYAGKVEKRFYAGDILGAIEASRQARLFTMISFAIGIAIGIISLLFTFLGIGINLFENG